MPYIDRYEIVRKLAVGGMADVFVALQWGDGGFVREVVLKRLHAHHHERVELLEDFRNEAELLSKLRFDGVPQVFEFRRSQAGEWYFAMELVRGPTLKEVVTSTTGDGRLPINLALAIIVALARLTDRLHDFFDPTLGTELGFVHGDITPSNVLLDAAGRVHLIDFGLAGGDAHRSRRLGPEFGIRGTAGYFAPELVEGRFLADRRADVFMLGVCAYEILMGRPPYSRDSLEYINQCQSGHMPAMDREGLPSAVAETVRACLSPAPGERPATAGEVARAMVTAAATAGIGVGASVIADHLDTYYADQAPARIGQANQAFVVPLPSAEPEEGSLSADERDELLADLALFAPEGSDFLDSVPSIVPDAMEEPEIDIEFEEPPPPPPPPTGDITAKHPAYSADDLLPRPSRRTRRTTPVALPTAEDLRSSRGDKTTEPSMRSSELRRKKGARQSDQVLENKAPDSGGFYIYVADDD